MPIRITGMNSGLDTESIISELVKAQKTKGEKVKKSQTKLGWKQEAWKELNSKIYKLFNSTLNNMRMETDYSKKTTDVSNSSVASVITSDNAMNATQRLKVVNLATTGYVTGEELSGATGNTTLASLGITAGSKIQVAASKGGTPKEIEITAGMTIDGLVGSLKNAGVEASFDSKNGRLHIASRKSGETNDFTITGVGSDGADALQKLGLAAAGQSVVTGGGKDATIELNGVRYTSDSNTFEVNGLTITALQEGGDEVTLTTRQDTDGIYNMIKNFFKEYNSLINEMDKLYNAESSKGYEPLTDDERDEMSDSEIEKWETKIKDSILRRDSNLSTISSGMKNILLQGVTVNGEKMYLSHFGIETLGYFNAGDNEKNAYHINGDEDDDAVSSKENSLKAAIAADPDTVISFFAQLSQNLYAELDKQSRSVDGVRSFGKFYDDKKMKEEYDNYTTKIKKEEEKLTALEDRWYKKFSAMETALAKMQSNQNAVSALLGG